VTTKNRKLGYLLNHQLRLAELREKLKPLRQAQGYSLSTSSGLGQNPLPLLEGGAFPFEERGTRTLRQAQGYS